MSKLQQSNISLLPSREGAYVNDIIFREYDIRGIVGKDLFLDQAYDLGKAIATYLIQENPTQTTFLIGRDGRLHSEELTQSLRNAILDLGFDVVDVGLVPTPALYFAACTLNIPCALEVTASHNPKEYNGIKIWHLWGEKIQSIKKIFKDKSFLPDAHVAGQIKNHDILSDYLEYLCNHFKHLKGADLKVVIDCANGPAGLIYPRLVEMMGWKNVTLLFQEVDGNFPHHEADPTVPENMVDVAKELECNAHRIFGIGLDGDCDRMNPMTKSGTLIPGDKLLALFARKMLENHPQAAIICDIKSSSSLLDVLHQWNGRPYLSPSGHSLIKVAMEEHQALLAGELSCHFFFKDRYFGFDDGIYASLRLFEILQESTESLDQLVSLLPHTESSPEIRILCKTEDEKKSIVECVKGHFAERHDMEIITLDGIRAQASYGWGLLRASNTQPALSMRFESNNKEGLAQVKQDFFEALQPYFDEKILREKIEL